MSVSVGELYATLKLDQSKFRGQIAEAGGGFGGLAKVATVAAVGIAGALIGVGVEATKSAATFQSNMELIATQAGASQQEVEQLKGAVLGLAGETATAPEELAAGLYHLESAGMHGAQAMDVLRIAAEGAKVGHADLESVTNALVASLKSGVGGITDASQAMGVLNAIVGAGNMRMEDLTAAIGTGILSSAKNFGVSIQSVGAALAAMTDQGIPAVDAANSLRSAMRLMAAPTKAATKELASIGLTQGSLAADLRSPSGIAGALADLKKHMDDAGLSATKQAQLLTAAFGGKQSQGILTLVGNMGVLDAKVKAVAAGTGGFSDAWAKTQADVSVKAEKVQASIEALGITLGDKLLPVAGQVLDGLTAVFSSPAMTAAINDLGDLMSSLATGIGDVFGRLSTTVGPAIGQLVATLSAGFADVSPTVDALGSAFDSLSSTFLPPLQDIFNSFTANILPALQDEFDLFTKTILPSLGQAFDWIATNIMPIVASIADTLATTVMPILGTALKTIVDIVRANWPTISAIAGMVGNAIKTAFQAIDAILKAVAPVVTNVARVVFPMISTAASVLLGIIKTVFGAIGDIWNAAWTVAGMVATGIGSAFRNLIGVFSTVGDAISGIFRGAMNMLIGLVNGIISAVDMIQVHIGRIGVTLPTGDFVGVGPMDWNGLQIPHLAYLAAGGIVSRPTLAMLGEGNRPEAVVPLSKGGLGGETHYHVTVQGDLKAQSPVDIVGFLQRLAAIQPGGAAPVLDALQRTSALGIGPS